MIVYVNVCMAHQHHIDKSDEQAWHILMKGFGMLALYIIHLISHPEHSFRVSFLLLIVYKHQCKTKLLIYKESPPS